MSHGLAVLAEGDDGCEQAAVLGERIGVEREQILIDTFDVLAQPLSLGDQAARGIEGPNDQGMALLQAS